MSDAGTLETVESARSSYEQVADAEVSQQRRVQDVAAEVLRLRLLQTQHQQLDADLQAATEVLKKLPAESIFQFRAYLDTGLRQSTRLVTLGTLNGGGGVDCESLLGLLECICLVCKVRLLTRRPEELLRAMHRLLRDPAAFIEHLTLLPVAPLSESKCLAPFLLSSDRGWMGRFNEAGRCYEALRAWLASYYQHSLASVDMETTSEELQRNEQLLRELSAPLGDGSTGGPCGPSAWRLGHSLTARSPSVGSNLSTGSRSRERFSGSRERSLKLGGSMGSIGSIGGRGTSQPRRTPVSSPLRTAFRASERALQKTVSPRVGGRDTRFTPGQPARAANTRSVSPQQHPAMEKKVIQTIPSERLSAPRYAYAQPVPATTPKPSARPYGSGYGAEETLKAAEGVRRQNNPALRARRSPSVQAGSQSVRGGASPPKSSRGQRADITMTSANRPRETGAAPQPVPLLSRTPCPRAPSSARASRSFLGSPTGPGPQALSSRRAANSTYSRLSPSASTSALEIPAVISSSLGDAGSGGTGGVPVTPPTTGTGAGSTLSSSMSTPALRARPPPGPVLNRQTPRPGIGLTVRGLTKSGAGAA
mmetsp:Transcript_44694/g.103312  ORF Transcript_44694/g.103312 Transcript_44694/m.103312 type:complete len:593 (-) Transcript_44694:107-1885(-)